MTKLEELAESLIEGQEDKVAELTKMALAEGIGATEIMNNGLMAGMNVVGARFKEADIFIPEVMLAAKAMTAGMEILKPLLVGSDSQSMGKVILGTVSGDVHKIGKNLVGIMLTGAGFEVIDLGEGVPPQKFIETVVGEKASLIAMSALLTLTMPVMKETIEELKEAGLENQVKTLVGGATVNQEYADEIGADGYAPDAVSAVQKAKDLLNLS
ncbi:MAG: corrinoid protein [Desulfobacteraceae bacterium]|nr:corrinoid protein [Desulfobacteraceae bacterium]